MEREYGKWNKETLTFHLPKGELRLLAKYPPKENEVCNSIDMTAETMIKILDGLEELGIVTREEYKGDN